MVVHVVWADAVLPVLQEHLVLLGFVGFEEVGYSVDLEGMEDSAEPEDHEFTGVLGLEDLLCLPLFFYF